MRAGVVQQVHFLDKQNDTRSFFSAVDLFLLSARNGSFPLINLESGLAGKPVICFKDENGYSEYTEIGGGSAVEYLNIKALSEKVMTLYRDRSLLDNAQIELPKVVRQNFSTAVQAPKILEVINKYYDNEELMFTEEPVLTFMTHIYYENSWEEISDKLINFDNGRNYFLFSISEACLIKEQIIENIKKTFTNSFCLVTSNIGKDIGGKMALIDLYLLLNIKSPYIIFLHDKQSPHSIAGETWKNNLFKIIDHNNKNLILSLMKDPTTGIVGSKDHIVNEYNDTTNTFRNNNNISKRLLSHFNISINNYDFLGGSIYWIRSSVIENFFTKNNPIRMRENLEAGNVIDLYEEKLAHTWERMFSWIAASQGYLIKGI
ncbi:MAG: rhamnan synthesis F family protein [Chitinophagaceae bacterium]